MSARLCGLLLALFLTPLQAVTPYVAEYEVVRNGKPVGHGTVTLAQIDATRWTLESQTRGEGGLAGLSGLEITERSQLQRAGDRWETQAYDYRFAAAWRRRERSVRVDPAADRITSRDRDAVHEFSFRPGVLDRQAVTLALAEALARGQRGEIEFTVVDRDELEPQRYRIGGEEVVETPAGPERALRAERIREAGSTRRTVTWMGVDRDFVPVQVLQEDGDGDRLQLRLVAFRRGR